MSFLSFRVYGCNITVDKDKEGGYPDAVVVEDALKESWIRVVDVEVSGRLSRLVDSIGIHYAELKVVWCAFRKWLGSIIGW